MTELTKLRMPATNRRLAQWRVKWLIEHSTSHQLLWCIDSFEFRNPPLRQAPNRYVQCYQTTADKRPQNDLTITQPLEQFFSCADNPIFPLPIKPRSAFGCNQLIHTEP
jgi:hypothetical protein